MGFYLSKKGLIHPIHFSYLESEATPKRLEKTKIHSQENEYSTSTVEKSTHLFAIEVMQSPVVSFNWDTPIEKIKNSMEHLGIRHIPILNDLKLIGMISDRDILKINNSGTFHFLKAKDIMTTIVLVCDEETPLIHFSKVLIEEKISCLPVIDKNHFLVGIISRTDILKVIIDDRIVFT